MANFRHSIPQARLEVIESQNLHDKFWTAIEKGNLQNVTLYLDQGASVFKGDFFDKNALHMAAEHGQFGVLKLLLNKVPFGLDIQDIEGNTPLHYAAMSGNKDCYKLLELNGAAVDTVNFDEKIPSDLFTSNSSVRFNNHDEIRTFTPINESEALALSNHSDQHGLFSESESDAHGDPDAGMQDILEELNEVLKMKSIYSDEQSDV